MYPTNNDYTMTKMQYMDAINNLMMDQTTMSFWTLFSNY